MDNALRVFLCRFIAFAMINVLILVVMEMLSEKGINQFILGFGGQS